MFKKLIDTITQNPYNITVIDHTHKTNAQLSLDDAINKFNCNLKMFDCIALTEATHDTLSSYKHYKPAKSAFVITKQGPVLPSNNIINYSDFSSLNCKFATPEHYADLFIDKVELTIPFNKKESKSFLRELFKAEKKVSRIKYKKHSNFNSVKYHTSFSIQSKQFGSIIILLDPIAKNINRLKISFNPSNCNVNDIQTLIRKLRKICGKNYISRIDNTNITRFDVTFDGDGYFVEDVIFNLDKSSYFKLFISPEGKQLTRIVGANRNTRVQTYDKSAEQLESGTVNACTERVNTRFEISIRPHNLKYLKGLTVKDLDKVTPFVPSLSVYDLSKLRQRIGENSNNWLIIKYFGISTLKRNTSNEQRIKLNRLLNDCKLDINKKALNTAIRDRLREVCSKFKNLVY